MTTLDYEPWDEHRDGPRLVVRNDGAPDDAMGHIRRYLDPPDDQPGVR